MSVFVSGTRMSVSNGIVPFTSMFLPCPTSSNQSAKRSSSVVDRDKRKFVRSGSTWNLSDKHEHGRFFEVVVSGNPSISKSAVGKHLLLLPVKSSGRLARFAGSRLRALRSFLRTGLIHFRICPAVYDRAPHM